MKLDPADVEGRRRVAIAQRVADAHRGLDDASLLAFVSGSTVDGLADERSDVDMSVVFAALPPEEALRVACRRVGGDWFWQAGDLGEGLVVAFHVDGIEVQIGYASEAGLVHDLDEVLVRHNPDTPQHKLAEGVLKAVPLAGAERLAALQARLADFPPALGRAMVAHGLVAPLSWRGAAQLLHRDAALWCRDVQVDACYRLLLVLCGLNRRYFTRFQVKRLHRLAAQLAIAPPDLAGRIERLLAAPAREAFDALHALEGEVIERVALHQPEIDLGPVRQRRAAYRPDAAGSTAQGR
ncbi:MAG: hypothetical protein KF788_17015 [Piscinibacter sp.]|nr:hypothetical protein [Piscinibacter sp.]